MFLHYPSEKHVPSEAAVSCQIIWFPLSVHACSILFLPLWWRECFVPRRSFLNVNQKRTFPVQSFISSFPFLGSGRFVPLLFSPGLPPLNLCLFSQPPAPYSSTRLTNLFPPSGAQSDPSSNNPFSWPRPSLTPQVNRLALNIRQIWSHDKMVSKEETLRQLQMVRTKEPKSELELTCRNRPILGHCAESGSRPMKIRWTILAKWRLKSSRRRACPTPTQLSSVLSKLIWPVSRDGTVSQFVARAKEWLLTACRPLQRNQRWRRGSSWSPHGRSEPSC